MTIQNPKSKIQNRIVVLGKSGSGKTTLACDIARRLGLPHIELDALHWEPNWTDAPAEVFRQRVAAALDTDGGWVVDGNYSKVRDIVWRQAKTLVWLDYSLSLVLRRLFRRTVRRVVSQEELWSGNRERWGNFLSLKPENNLFLWTIKSHRKHHREYPALFQQPEYSHLHIVRLHSPQETQRWLKGIGTTKENYDQRA